MYRVLVVCGLLVLGAFLLIRRRRASDLGRCSIKSCTALNLVETLVHSSHSNFVESIAYGSAAARIQLIGVAPLLDSPSTRVIEALNDGRTVGLLAGLYGSGFYDGKSFETLYFTCYAVHSDWRQSGVARLLLEKQKEVLHARHATRGSNPLIAFAIIEVENFPSMGASKHFLETTRQLQVTAYSFMNPKFNSNVHLLEESDYNVMVENLRAMYRGHVMVSEIEKIYPHSAVQAYYVFKRNGRVTAGAQVNVFAFRLVECQCFWLFKMLSELPIFRVLPENLIFHSCGLNNIWHESGCEGDIPVLIESIMARHLRHVALFVYDTGSAPSLHIARTTSCRYRNGVIGTMCTSVFPPYCIKAGVLDSPWPIEHLKNTPWLFTYNGS